MNRNYRDEDNSEDVYSYGIKKNTYWKIYGVKRFPYRGKRKYTPLLYPSFDGGLKISNDVFGLTISQFERMYEACLERRKTKEQWILNLRYPDKSSKEYLEYLEKCSYSNKDHMLNIENDQGEKYLYDHLVKTVGTEIDIRKRQRLFIIHDMIANACVSGSTKISSGSLAEGLDLPGSDRDIMYVIESFDILQSVNNNIKHSIHRTILVMETDINHPGFTRLKVEEVGDNVSIEHNQFCPETCTGEMMYLSVNDFLTKYAETHYGMPVSFHGPCVSNESRTLDIAFCLRSKYLPKNAIPWALRHRCQWPTNYVVDKIRNYGCLLVPIGPKVLPYNDLLWRLSFSVAEKMLIHSFNFTQLLCYGLLKLVLKRIINTQGEVKDLLCSYFLKTALFWVSEEVNIDTFQCSKLYYCFSLCLDKIISWVNICFCPNYFIPEHNMFLGKINQRNNKILLCVLESIKSGGIDMFINNLFAPVTGNHHLSSSDPGSLFIMLDFLIYRIISEVEGITSPARGISGYNKGRLMAESLLKSETSTLFIEISKHYIARFSSKMSQKLQPSNIKSETYSLRQCYHKLLQNGTKTDAVSGWLLYASYFYVTKQYNATLKLTDYILSKCSPDMIFLGAQYTKDGEIFNSYKSNVHSTMTLNEKITIFTVGNIQYLMNSSLIPEELRLEVKGRTISIPPVFMSHCLRFLCYHHFDDIPNRHQALRDLFITSQGPFTSDASVADSLTILGVCCEISGYKDTAYQCYFKSLQYINCKCSTAEIRKLRLFDI
ncbi:Hypothetical predicted protein [Mytilus galloprovincialis]|uniref:Mab-21-like HhH/H2TH-like domain-containing protein n=1 Tax=Mytilus galloprovincialis TaxID=29158 RepID=A0A8B6GIB6_MYTGA|nr:Hypothetical predicted protein [Mytilus galloprovincialis]